MSTKPEIKDALLIVDVQNDFCRGGALAVPGADEVVPVLNDWIEHAKDARALVVASRDWHPPDHCSFKPHGPWPPHCVRDTNGAKFHHDLHLPERTVVVSKATETKSDAYSAFENTDLADQLRGKGVERLFVGGLATDYCVKATVLDGLQAGFDVHVVGLAIRAVNVEAGDGDRALREMIQAGAVIERERGHG